LAGFCSLLNSLSAVSFNSGRVLTDLSKRLEGESAVVQQTAVFPRIVATFAISFRILDEVFTFLPVS